MISSDGLSGLHARVWPNSNTQGLRMPSHDGGKQGVDE